MTDLLSDSARYAKNYSIDGHPVCDHGKPMKKDEIINKLNEYEIFKQELVKSVNPILKAHIAGVIAVCEIKAKRINTD